MDFERALLMLNVIDKALGHPQLRPLIAAASDELNAMIEPPKEEPVEPVPEPVDPQPEADGSAPKVGRRL